MSLLATLTGTPFSRAVAKRDARRKAQTDAEAKAAGIRAQIDSDRLALRAAVADDGGADPDKIAVRIVKAEAELRSVEELIAACRVATEAAEAGYADAVEKERAARVVTAIDTAKRAWLEAREAVAPAALALAEARGRERQLCDRLVKLYAADRKAGGSATVILNDKTLKPVGELAADAMYAKHGERVDRADLQYHDRAFGYLVEGLAGPDPEIDPEATS